MFIWLELPTKTCMNADFEEGCSNKRWTLIDRLKCVSNKRAAQLSRVAFIKCLVSCQHSLFIYWQPIRAECIFNNFFLFIVSRRVVFSRGVRSMLMECLTPRPKSHPKKGRNTPQKTFHSHSYIAQVEEGNLDQIGLLCWLNSTFFFAKNLSLSSFPLLLNQGILT